MCALRSRERPPPEPRAIPTTLKRPAATSSVSTSRPAPSSQPATKRAISSSPAPSGTRSAVRLIRLDELNGPILFSRGFDLPRLLLQELDLEPLDAGAVDVEDVEPQAVVQDFVPGLRRATERAEHEPRDRVVVVLRELLTELLVEVVDRERA